MAAIPHWYAALNKPSFNPPDAIFGPVWTLVYALMAIAAWPVWKAPGNSALRTAALRIFWLQLVLNFAWSWTFFRQHQLAGALLEIGVLWLAILAATLLFLPVTRLAAGHKAIPPRPNRLGKNSFKSHDALPHSPPRPNHKGWVAHSSLLLA